MTKPDYSALDAEIVRQIDGGFTCFGSLSRSPMVVSLASEHATSVSEPWRVIDRRLQALRRAGKIRYHRQLARWEVCG